MKRRSALFVASIVANIVFGAAFAALLLRPLYRDHESTAPASAPPTGEPSGAFATSIEAPAADPPNPRQFAEDLWQRVRSDDLHGLEQNLRRSSFPEYLISPLVEVEADERTRAFMAANPDPADPRLDPIGSREGVRRTLSRQISLVARLS